jgi:hypothetical protein
MATEVFILFLSSATECNYSNSAVICATGKGTWAERMRCAGGLIVPVCSARNMACEAARSFTERAAQ